MNFTQHLFERKSWNEIDSGERKTEKYLPFRREKMESLETRKLFLPGKLFNDSPKNNLNPQYSLQHPLKSLKFKHNKSQSLYKNIKTYFFIHLIFDEWFRAMKWWSWMVHLIEINQKVLLRFIFFISFNLT